MADGQVLIKDLPEATTVADSSFIPVDNGNLTQKISVENFNDSSNQTAKAYAEQAQAAATTATDAIADVNAKVDAAQAQANRATTQAGYAQDYAADAQTYAGNAQGYANTAQGSATNAAASASSASSSADAAQAQADIATTKAGDVQTYASNAQTYADNAQTYAGNAQGYANTAQTCANTAQSSATSAAASASAAALSADRAAAWSSNSPYIGANKNWYVYDITTEQFVDTGILAEGVKGDEGTPGNLWYTGTDVSGQSITPTIFNTGIAYANKGDLYLNVTEGAVYHCTTPGDDTTAKWVYDFTLTGGGGGGTYDYNDLVNQPKINNVTLIGNKTSSDLGLTQVNSDWNASSGVAQILNKPTLAAVATSGSYNDLNNKPTIPDAVAVKGDAESTYRTGNVNLTKGNIGLGNVGNFKAVSTVASQGLTDTEKSNARANIGAGTSSSDTKNTAGTTNSTSKLYLAGATSQAANPQTYSNANCYASGGALYSNSTQVATDGWTGTKSVDSTNQVTFTGLNDNYGYDLYCQNKLVGISAMTKTGSGTSVTLKFTLTGAASGDVCKLRIIRN